MDWGFGETIGSLVGVYISLLSGSMFLGPAMVL